MVEATSSRTAIRDELVAFAQTHINAWESYADKEFTSSDLGFNYVSRQTEHNGLTLTVSKASIPGLTLDQHRTYRADIINQVPKLDSKITMVQIPDVDGQTAIIQHIKMPMIFTNRSIVLIYYLIEHEDGSIEFIGSSKGTDGVAAAQAGIIKKNVIANNIINYSKLTPTEDGCDFIAVQCMDIGGSVPDAMKRKGAGIQAKSAMRMIHLVKTGAAPPA